MAVDVHELLRLADEQQQARAAQFPDEQDVIRMMVQCRLRLEEMGWRPICYAPRDGTYVEVIVPGFIGPSQATKFEAGWFVSSNGDLWPAQPSHFRPISNAFDTTKAV